MADTALQLHRGDGAAVQVARPGYTQEQVDLVKATVAKGASDNELKLFMHLAQTYGLDPFAKEIWCIKYGSNAATIFTSRDGYLKIANGHPAFNGIQSDVVHENDHFQIGNGSVEHAYNFPRGVIVGAYALVFRKDRQFPVYVFAPFEEYYSEKNGTWAKYPSAMILKVAEAMALKRAFSISGLVTKEELDASEPEPEQKRIGFPGEELYAGPVEVGGAPQAAPAQRAAGPADPGYEEKLKQLVAWLDSRRPQDLEEALEAAEGKVEAWPEEFQGAARAAIEKRRFACDERMQTLHEMRAEIIDGYREGSIDAVQAQYEPLIAGWPEPWKSYGAEEWNALCDEAVEIVKAEREAEAKASMERAKATANGQPALPLDARKKKPANAQTAG